MTSKTDVLAGFVLARASAGLVDSTIRNDTNHLELIRDWFGRPLWEMQPADADAYFGKVLRKAKPSTRTGRAAALTVFLQFLEHFAGSREPSPRNHYDVRTHRVV
jgi:integrase/recombinase XerD